MRARVRWSPLAIARATEAADHIAADDEAAAARWVGGLFDAVKLLGLFPNRARIVPEVNRPEIRELIYVNHRVVYRISPHTVEILTDRHARRLFAADEIEGNE